MMGLIEFARLIGKLADTLELSRQNSPHPFGRSRGGVFRPTFLKLAHDAVHNWSGQHDDHRDTQKTIMCLGIALGLKQEGIRNLLSDIDSGTFKDRPRLAIELLVRLAHSQMAERK